MMCEMTWRPDSVTSAAAFARDFAVRRHGLVAGRDARVASSYDKMIEASSAYSKKWWSRVKGTENVIAYGTVPSNLYCSYDMVDIDDAGRSVGLFDEAISALPEGDPVAGAPFLDDHRYRLALTRLYEDVEANYLRALTGTDKDARIAAIDAAIQSAMAEKWILVAHGGHTVQGSIRSSEKEGFPVLPTAYIAGNWLWFGGYDTVDNLDIGRLPVLRELRRRLVAGEEIKMPWAAAQIGTIPPAGIETK
jgi:hypothetical protein